MRTIRTTLRHLVESVFTGLRVPDVVRLFATDRTLIIAYHNIVSDADLAYGDGTLHLSVARFTEHVEILREQYDVVSLRDLRQASRRSGKPRIVITFDDAYVGAVKNAVPLLARAGLPFTIFVAPGRLGGHVFWWDSVEGRRVPGPTVEFRDHVLTALAGRDENAREQAHSFDLRLRDSVPEESRTASQGELLKALDRAPLLTLGSHSWSHVCLPNVSLRELREELTQSLDWVKRLEDRGVLWIAYPYGRFSPEVERIALEVGYAGGLRIEGGSMRPEQIAGFSLPRTDVPARVSRNGFTLRLSGLVR